MTLIEGRDITIGYEKDGLIKNLTFHVDSGDYLCIVGENGSGKSTFVKTVLGLVEPVKGRVEIAASGIGYLPQQSAIDSSFPSSVTEVVLSGCLNNHRGIGYSSEERERAFRILKRLGMEKKSGKPFGMLSGGEKQRVLLSRALMATEEIILLDEPITNLDTGTTAEFYGLVNDLNRSGTAVIMVTHDIHPVLNSAGTILHFFHGGGYFFGSKDDYFKTDGGRKFLKEAGHGE